MRKEREFNKKTYFSRKFIFYDTLDELFIKLSSYLNDNRKLVIIVDTNIFKIYKNYFYKYIFENIDKNKDKNLNQNEDLKINKRFIESNFLKYKKINSNLLIIKFKANEKNKSIRSAENIFKILTKIKIDKNYILIGIGGGITLDLTGFVGANYKRGLKTIFVPTTLLAMVDAAIGGKNGLNLYGYKNIVGTFKFPKKVLICKWFLPTMEIKSFISGLFEIIKYGFITHDKSFFINKVVRIYFEKIFISDNFSEKNYLKKNSYFVINRIVKENSFYNLIKTSIKIKLFFVKKDPYDRFERKILNYGHTFGHAIEKYFKNKIEHGIAVGIGMAIILYIELKIYLLEFYLNSNDEKYINNDFIFNRFLWYIFFLFIILKILSIEKYFLEFLDKNIIKKLKILTKNKTYSELLHYSKFFQSGFYIDLKKEKLFDVREISKLIDIIDNDKKKKSEYIELVFCYGKTKKYKKDEILKIIDSRF